MLTHSRIRESDRLHLAPGFTLEQGSWAPRWPAYKAASNRVSGSQWEMDVFLSRAQERHSPVKSAEAAADTNITTKGRCGLKFCFLLSQVRAEHYTG